MPFRASLTCAAAAAAVAVASSAGVPQPAPSTDAVVFIRVFGTARAEFDETWRRAIERRGLEFATGSGFVISPSGYVLTNHHVVSGDEVELKVDGRDVKISIAVERIEVVFGSGQRFDASVLAADPSSDLAVLSLAGAADLPYVPLGDSDAVALGAPVRALGYPFGRSLEVGRAAAAEIVPSVTVTSGAVSAVRDGDDEEPRFLQITNALNPGNSGGPVVDADGFAQGVVVMKVTKAESVGFALAINRAKDFLERHGLDSVLQTPRLGLGGTTDLALKGLRLRMPHGFSERHPLSRTRLEAGSEQIVLRIDRVASRWTSAQLEQALLQGTLFDEKPYERLSPAGDGRDAARNDVVQGGARRFDADGRAERLEYTIVATGRERIVARYIGAFDHVAFNLGVLRASLASIEVEPLLRGEPPPPHWRAGSPDDSIERLLAPDGWHAEPGVPLGCPGRWGAQDAAQASSPLEDFTQAARIAVWGVSRAVTRADLAVGCKHPVREDGSYGFVTSRAGIQYAVEGRFVQRGEAVFQIEVAAAHDQAAASKLQAWLRDWRAALEAK